MTAHARSHGRVPAPRCSAARSRGHRRRDRRAALPARRVLRRARRGRRPRRVIQAARAPTRMTSTGYDGDRRLRRARQHGQRAGRQPRAAPGLAVVGHDAAGPDRAPDGVDYVDSVADVARGPRSWCAACPTVPRRSGRRRARPPPTDASPRTSSTPRPSGCRGARPSTHCWPIHGSRLRRRAGVRWRRRRPGPHAGGDVRRRRRRVRARRAGARRAQRPPLPGRRPAGHGAGDEARQQLPLRDHARRDERGRRVRPSARASTWPPCSRCSTGRAAGARPPATSSRNHVLTGRYASGFTNSLMAKDVQLYLQAVDEGGGPATVGAVDRRGVERVRRRRARRRLHPHLSLRPGSSCRIQEAR